jgi:hypothetical protein
MTTADTDEELNDQSSDQPEDVQQPTDGDHSDQRLPENAEPANDDKDGADEVQDPLLLAQMDAEPEPKAEQKPTGDAKPKPKAKNPATEEPKDKTPPADKSEDEVDDNPKPEDDQSAQADLKAAQEKLPGEDWQKLSHKGKSQILSMQRVVRTSQAAMKKIQAEAQEQTEAYHTVEKIRTKHGLEPQEFVNAISLGGAIKAGRKEVVQFLETTLDALRKHHGITVETPKPDVRVETLGIDPDELEKLAAAAENFDLDAIAKLRAIAVKAKGEKAKLASQPPVAKSQEQQPPTAKPHDRQQQNETAEAAEFRAIGDALEAMGVSAEDMEGHVVNLIRDVTGGDAGKLPPPGKRLRALLEAHHKRIQAAKSPPVKPTSRVPTPPLSGRTGPARQVVATDPSTVDPLKHAFGPAKR